MTETTTEAGTPPLIACVGVTMYLAGAWGSTDSILGFLFGATAIFVFLYVVQFIRKKEIRMRRQLEWQIQDLMSNPRVAAGVLGTNMPTWLTFPAVERSVWFSTVMESLWPRIRKATEDSLQASYNPWLQSLCPGFLKEIKATAMSLGTIPINVVGVQSAENTKDATLIDMHIQWNGNPDIRITATMNDYVSVDVAVTDLQLKGVLRMTMGPHVDVWPCFAAMSFTFIGKPTLDFNLKAAKVPLDAIPGLSQWLDNFMRDTLVWLMVYPRRYVWPMLDENLYGGQEADANPAGTLTIQLLNCKGLPKKGVRGNTDPYCSLLLSSNPQNIKKTATHHSTTAPTFSDKERFTFMVYGTPGERLNLQVYHDSGVRKDKVIATSECFTQVLTSDCRGGCCKEYTYDLTRSGNSRVAKNTKGGVFEPKQGSGRSTIRFRATYRAFVETAAKKRKKAAAEAAEKKRKEEEEKKAAAGGVSTRDLESPSPPGSPAGSEHGDEDSGSNFSDEFDDFGDDDTYTHANSLFQLPADGTPLGGLLIITLHRCNDLKKADLFGKSDPYVVFSVGGNVAKSETIMKTLDPEYGDARFELEVSNIAQELLKVTVFDYDALSGTFGKDDEIGNCHISLKEIFESNLRLDSTWALVSKGTISLECRLLVHEPDTNQQSSQAFQSLQSFQSLAGAAPTAGA